MSNLGFRVLPIEKKASKELIEKYRDVVTPHVSDNLNRLYSFSNLFRPYHMGGRLIGTAVTVKTRPGDNLLIHKAIDMSGPGDVIVVEAGGDTTNALFGEIMLRLCQKRGISGVILDGAMRDISAFEKDNFPIYAKGVTHRGPYKDGPGEVNVNIALDGTIVKPGDIIIGDEDGIVCVPLEQAEDIIKLVKNQEKKEIEMLQSIEEGKADRSWVNQTLKERGCIIYATPDDQV